MDLVEQKQATIDELSQELEEKQKLLVWGSAAHSGFAVCTNA